MTCEDSPRTVELSVRDVTLALLAARADDATICPSEVARAIATGNEEKDWRSHMSAVHETVRRMAADGDVRVTWKGTPRAVGDGPYRIGLKRT